MNDTQRRAAAKQFVADWTGRGDEKQETQRFWISLLQNVFGVENATDIIEFEKRVEVVNNDGSTTVKFIDGYLPATRVLIEQKGVKIDLKKGERQSDGAILSPFQQGRRYGGSLPNPEQPRWIIACNFQAFEIHDMNRPNDAPEVVLLSDLEKEYYRLQFLVDTTSESIRKEMEVSLKAGQLVGVLYDELLKQYKDPDDPETLKSLNALCVRLVFCLYAEDAGIFGSRTMFHDYLSGFEAKDVRRALGDLFRVLDQSEDARDKYLADDSPALAAFPYVNGGLFEKEIEIPPFTDELKALVLSRASEDFDWSAISPTIFGAVFESTLNPETRRSGGMHYTSIENIHKVIDPLFLDDLKAELEEIKSVPVDRTRKAKLEAYQRKLAGLSFLDPACGSGNFLTETYISLRRLENEVISLLNEGQKMILGVENPIMVSIGQFYGIEINDFAVTVAKTALWIAESQMMKETEDIVHAALDFLPLKSYANITEANALRLDWEEVVPKRALNYIMGNPPFVGGMMTTKEQKADMQSAIGDIKGLGELDYVAAWYYKAADYIQGTRIEVTFVSTNSICQGQQAVTLWKPLFEKGVRIQFAYRTFRWDSEAKIKAHVHCVVIGFSLWDRAQKMLFDEDSVKYVDNINSYLAEAPNTFVESRTDPLCDVPKIRFGSMPRDGGGFILSDEEKDELLKKEPLAAQWVRPYLGAYEFINNKSRWCLWMVGANPHELKQCPTVMRRVESVRDFRASSVAAGTRKFAETPTLFCQIAQPDSEYIAVPKTSSERRRYIPMGFLPNTVIASDLLFLIPNATLYHFGVLTSNVHNAWMRAVCGRLEMSYRYSKDIVYNNFPWCEPTDEQRAKIEQTAQGILDARALYPDASLADLYDETTMPPELRAAHQQNDRAVMRAYGFSVRDMTEQSCVAELMRMYRELAGA